MLVAVVNGLECAVRVQLGTSAEDCGNDASPGDGISTHLPTSRSNTSGSLSTALLTLLPLCTLHSFESGYSPTTFHSLHTFSIPLFISTFFLLRNYLFIMKTATVLSALLAVALGAPSVNDALYRRQGQNFQTFTGALGGIAATPVTDSGDAKRKFQVKGDTFVNVAAALQRSCDQQFNACANKANGGDKTLSVSACSDQKSEFSCLHKENNN